MIVVTVVSEQRSARFRSFLVPRSHSRMCARPSARRPQHILVELPRLAALQAAVADMDERAEKLELQLSAELRYWCPARPTRTNLRTAGLTVAASWKL